MASLGTKYNRSPLKGNDTYGLLGGTSIYTKYTTPNTSSKTTSSKKEVVGPKTTPKLTAYPKTKSTSSSGGTSSTVSSYSGTLKPYLDAMLSAFNQGADANKALAKQTYDTTIGNLGSALNQAQQTYDQRIRDLDALLGRYQQDYDVSIKNLDTLLGRYQQDYDVSIKNLDEALRRAQGTYDTGAENARESYAVTADNLKRSLERFQAENTKNVENQRRSYLTDQAALESARLEADRQTRIDAAARGLGGSGLQQLAQLQNLLNQGQDISNLATENQGVLDELRTQLREAEEDNAANLAEAGRTRDNTLNALLTALNNAKATDKLGREEAQRTLTNARADVESDRTEALRTLTNARADVEANRADALTALNNAKAAQTTGAQNAWTVYENALKGINADLAKSIADANYNFGQNAYSASQRGTGSSSLNEASILASAYGALEQDFDTDLAAIYRGKGSAKDKAAAAENLYDTYKKKSSELYGGYGSNYKSLQDINLSNFKTLKDYYANK